MDEKGGGSIGMNAQKYFTWMDVQTKLLASVLIALLHIRLLLSNILLFFFTKFALNFKEKLIYNLYLLILDIIRK